MPLLRELDSATGTVIRASCRSAMRYEHDHPGSSIHVDVKEPIQTPDGGGWHLNGRVERPARKCGPGYAYVYTVIDGNSRVAHAQLYDDEKGASTVEVLNRTMTFCRAARSER
ncbi:hypothetical protein CBF90_14385 [Microbacterium sp. AISO3]|uniref:DDE-type integrase/transposase/recombinase n=1 Tax=Microbacterium sp. AISO3 TaxID=2002831 RepID=UPI000B4D3D85|nr:DDE-type integrase/transposase/recombinase [Microbacterium sp. AISO3]OWP20254.1 hypothetical protein CBF90_17920 [Microbacterium sp. AISO3]OWP20902.1 hypothetical protein CBF90_14385 [Microbacterium sp. AISO3]